MPRPLFWLWLIVVVALAIPMVTAGFFFAEEYGASVAFLVSFVAWAYVAAMTYVAARTIAQMWGPE
jgi:hypothetical protein